MRLNKRGGLLLRLQSFSNNSLMRLKGRGGRLLLGNLIKRHLRWLLLKSGG